MEDGKLGSFDNGDPNTTNLYLGNLNPKVKVSLVYIFYYLFYFFMLYLTRRLRNLDN